MDQRNKSITILLKLLARGEVYYFSRFKLIIPLLIVLFGILSIYDSYMENMGLVFLNVKNQGYYSRSNNKTLYLCNITPLLYNGEQIILLGFNRKPNCTSFLEVTICPITCGKVQSLDKHISSSTVLRENLRKSVDEIMELVKVLVIMVVSVGIFMSSYENVVTSNQLVIKLKYWKLNIKIAYVLWALVSVFVLVFISMSLGVAMATISSFLSSIVMSTIYMKPLITSNDLILVYLSLSSSSLLGTIIGLKGLRKCCT